LSWSTLTESNASHFDIERSTNATSWINTGSVNTKANDGNSTSLLTYTYADDITGIHGLLYYRLKMIDKNGRVAYSNLASLNIGADPAGFTVNMYPNPVSSYNSGALRFTSNKRQGLVLKLVSADGIVLSTRYVVLQPGTTNINLTEITNKPAGIYTIQVINVNTNDRLGVVRFMKK
jgi:hypothetical protein